MSRLLLLVAFFVPEPTFGDSEDCPGVASQRSTRHISVSFAYLVTVAVGIVGKLSAATPGGKSQNRRHISRQSPCTSRGTGLLCLFSSLSFSLLFFFRHFDSRPLRSSIQRFDGEKKKTLENFWKWTLRSCIHALSGHKQPEDAVAEGTPEGRPGNCVLRPPPFVPRRSRLRRKGRSV